MCYTMYMPIVSITTINLLNKKIKKERESTSTTLGYSTQVLQVITFIVNQIVTNNFKQD